MLNLWYTNNTPDSELKKSKSVLHPFSLRGSERLTINPYQGCHHRCGYCYATYEWSPEFYDKIYSKSNAPEILENQLKSWKSETIEPVMISSATDAYQPSELKFELTRKCIKVLQRYNIPYYVFTKSTIISRDLDLYRQYRENCFVVWSITTCEETIRRIVEPGTPSSNAIFSVIRKFCDAGIRCGVNIDPIIPLLTDSQENMESILDRCTSSGVGYVSGAILRLRADIWERMKTILTLFDMRDRIREYCRIFRFTEPLTSRYNISASQSYSGSLLENLREKVLRRGISFDLPELVGVRSVKNRGTFSNDKNQQQPTLMDYI